MLKRGFSAILIGRIDDLYEDVCDLLAWSEEKLVRYAGGDVDDIAGFDCDPGAAFDPAALYLMGRRGLAVGRSPGRRTPGWLPGSGRS